MSSAFVRSRLHSAFDEAPGAQHLLACCKQTNAGNVHLAACRLVEESSCLPGAFHRDDSTHSRYTELAFVIQPMKN